MPQKLLTEQDRTAAILKRLVTPGYADPEFAFFDKLPPLYREIAYLTLTTGSDREAREIRLRHELIARDLAGYVDQVLQADPAADLGAFTGSDEWLVHDLTTAYTPAPPLDWVIHDLIPLPSLTIMFSQPKMLKSLLATYAAVCASVGARFCPLAGREEDTGRMTYPTVAMLIDYENGLRKTNERVSAFARQLEIPEAAPLFYTSMASPWLDLTNKAHVGRLAELLGKYGARFVVFDHLAALIGALDLNSSEMSTVMGSLRWLVEQLQAAVLVIAHSVKHSHRFKIRDAESLSGHASILANADLALLVTRDLMQPNRAIIKSVAERGAPVGDFAADFRWVHKSDGSKELERAWFEGVEAEQVEEIDQADIEAEIFDLLEGSPGLNFTALKAALLRRVSGLSENMARNSILSLEHEKSIYFKKGAKNSKLYFVKNGRGNRSNDED